MSAPAWIAALVGLGLQVAPAWGQTPLPAIQFRLHCVDNGAEATAAEIDGILALHEFAREHDAQVVWLDTIIEADNGAGTCSRDADAFPDQPGPSGDRARIVLHRCPGEEASAVCSPSAPRVQVTANGPPLAFPHSILLPDAGSLNPALPYRYGGYGDRMNYQGPFIIRFFEGTGYGYVTFHQPDPALPEVWERARCNARPDACEP